MTVVGGTQDDQNEWQSKWHKHLEYRHHKHRREAISLLLYALTEVFSTMNDSRSDDDTKI